MKNVSFGFIGCGNMATAIINGIITDKNQSLQNINIYDVDETKVAHLGDLGCFACASISEIYQKSDIIFLCIKPQNFSEVLSEMKTLVTNKKLFVSIAAGVSTEMICRLLNCDCPIIRVMPNTPLLVGMGATVLSRTDSVSEEDFELVCDTFASCGTVEKIDEAQMNEIISVSGSSPAYLYLFAKVISEHARSYGIDEALALRLFCQTMQGSAEMLLSSGHTPQTLIDMVSSKGGTTLAALEVFQKEGFSEIITAAMDACTKRARELGKTSA